MYGFCLLFKCESNYFEKHQHAHWTGLRNKKKCASARFHTRRVMPKKKYKRASLNKKKALQSDWITQPRARARLAERNVATTINCADTGSENHSL